MKKPMKKPKSSRLDYGATPKPRRRQSVSASSALPSSRPPKSHRPLPTDSSDDRRKQPMDDEAQRTDSLSQTPESRLPSAVRLAVRPSARGMGGAAPSVEPCGGIARGTPMCVFSGKVRNLGRGVWGFGSILGWIPADVRPWDYCHRKGWIQIFSRHTMPLAHSRPYVLGDDGKFHLPQAWEEV